MSIARALVAVLLAVPRVCCQTLLGSQRGRRLQQWLSNGHLERSGWTVAFDTQQLTGTQAGNASFAIDDNKSTFWHSQWEPTVAPQPHHLDVDFNGRVASASGLVVSPRQGSLSGAQLVRL
jgi:hypothetical protein